MFLITVSSVDTILIIIWKFMLSHYVYSHLRYKLYWTWTWTIKLKIERSLELVFYLTSKNYLQTCIITKIYYEFGTFNLISYSITIDIGKQNSSILKTAKSINLLLACYASLWPSNTNCLLNLRVFYFCVLLLFFILLCYQTDVQ